MRLQSNTYDAIHQWLITEFGKADQCEFCLQINKKKYEYALKKNCNYKRKRSSFLMLCTSCHRKYDYKQETKEKIRETMKLRRAEKQWPIPKSKGQKLNLSIEQRKIRSDSKLGDKNPAKRPEVREKIRQTIKKLHRSGVYKK